MIHGLVALTRAGLIPRTTETPILRKQIRSATTDRTELLTHLHILAGLQERDCRISELQLSEAPAAVRAYAVAWLYGAGCALCDQPERHSEALASLVAQIASRKIGIRQSEAIQAISTLTSCGVLLACFRAGLEGAEFWQSHQYVQPESSLYSAITANALI
ncbi:hypothetical protein [Marinobacter salexigens]|uniref:hypothetical protein n=1 Tax=Marinobacter salexigens TaxID=1925763 RepID=UPI001EFC7596|nr:hypothetical protein [Marinobacter salexigens]